MELLEPIILAKYDPLANLKVTDLLPFLAIIAVDWNLNLKLQKDFDIAMKILNRSIRYN